MNNVRSFIVCVFLCSCPRKQSHLYLICIGLVFGEYSGFSFLLQPWCHSNICNGARFLLNPVQLNGDWSYACTSGEMLLLTDATKRSINCSYFVVTVLLIVLQLIYTAFGGNNIFWNQQEKKQNCVPCVCLCAHRIDKIWWILFRLKCERCLPKKNNNQNNNNQHC